MTIGDSAPILGDCHIGDSISVNGCCLTVTEFNITSFKVGLAPETLSRTNLGAHFIFGFIRMPAYSKSLRRTKSRRSGQLGACCSRPHPFRRSFRASQRSIPFK
jgi:Lumazine binding domain